LGSRSHATPTPAEEATVEAAAICRPGNGGIPEITWRQIHRRFREFKRSGLGDIFLKWEKHKMEKREEKRKYKKKSEECNSYIYRNRAKRDTT